MHYNAEEYEQELFDIVNSMKEGARKSLLIRRINFTRQQANKRKPLSVTEFAEYLWSLGIDKEEIHYTAIYLIVQSWTPRY